MSYPGQDGEETRLSALVLRWMTRWLQRVIDAVLAGYRRFGIAPDPTAVYSSTPLWMEAVDDIIPELLPAARLGWDAILPDSDSSLVSTDTYVVAALAMSRNLLVRIPEEVYNLIFAEISDGVNDGEGMREIAARVERILDVTGSERWPGRAMTIAVTEVNRAANAGALAAAYQAERDEGRRMLKRWLCLPGDNLVAAAGIEQVARRAHQGEIIGITTAGGRWVTMTAQHPVLTTRGWVAAELLKPGDQALCIAAIHPERAPEVYRSQVTIGHFVDPLLRVEGPTGGPWRMPGGMHLYRDAFVNEDVYVAPAEGDLLPDLEAEVAEELRHLLLELPDVTLGALARNGSLFGGGPRGGSVPEPSESRGPDFAESAILPLNANPSSLTSPPQDHSGLPQDPGNGAGGSPEPCRQCADRITRLVEVDEIVRVQVVALGGHVYDFTTSSQWFAASGVIVHNSSDDSRVRPAHRRADGQTVPLGQPFQVGGSALMFPSDPVGLPEDVIFCRCSMQILEEWR